MATHIFHAQSYRLFLSQILGERCARNPRYSLRAFARDLNTSASFLSLLFRNKHSLSPEKARVIATCLGLAPHEQDYFVAMVKQEQSGRNDEMYTLRQKHAFTILDAERDLAPDLSLLDFALYLKISLLGHVSLADASRHFGLEAEDCAAICGRLVTLGWLEEKGEGWMALKGYARTESFDSSESKRIFHQKILKLGLEQLDGTDVKERYFYSFVFSLLRDDYDELCETIVRFCHSKCDAYASRDKHNRIYALGVQILPVSQLDRLPLLRPFSFTAPSQ